MLIDAHCHIDMLENPEAYLHRQERKGNITIGMTNLPSHFEMGYQHFRNLKRSRLALGYHPLMVAENPNELRLFKKYLSYTSYIGEILEAKKNKWRCCEKYWSVYPESERL